MQMSSFLAFLVLYGAHTQAAGPPDPPFAIGITSIRGTSAVVQWTPGNDNSSPITKYIIELNHSYAPTEWIRVAMVNPPLLSADVTLSPYANFTFRVIAVNLHGESAPSHPSRVIQTNPERPYQNPANVRSDRHKPGVLIIQWDRMEQIQQNGPGFKYLIRFARSGSSNYMTWLVSDWRKTELEFNFVQVYQPYEVYVEAQNNEGSSTVPALKHILFSGEDVPNVFPSDFELMPDKPITAQTAWFQWYAVDPSPHAMRGKFHGYKIKFWKAEDPNNTLREVQIDRLPRPYRFKETAEVTNLYPNSHIQAEVVAVNTFFESTPSVVVSLITPEEA